MSSPIIIGLTGLTGAGKDSVADVLVTHAGFNKIAFADNLRLEVAAAFRLGDAYGLLTNRVTKEKPMHSLALCQCDDIEFLTTITHDASERTAAWLREPRSPRQIMQWWGTEYRRHQDSDYWIDQLEARLHTLQSTRRTRIVVTDCRFYNEARSLRDHNGEIWRVVRPGMTPVEGNHASQTDGTHLNPDAVIVNDATIIGLAHQTLHTLQRLHGGVILPPHELPT